MFSRLAAALATVITLLNVKPALAVSVNQPAPAFTLKDSQKRDRSLASAKGQVVFVNFWASWCAPCQVELPELGKLAREFRGQKVRIWAINVDEDRAEAKRVLGRLGAKSALPDILWDAQSKTVSRFNVETMPSSFVIDKTGTIRFIHSGFHGSDPGAWRAEISQLLK